MFVLLSASEAFMRPAVTIAEASLAREFVRIPRRDIPSATISARVRLR